MTLPQGMKRADGNQYTECPNWTSTCRTPPSIVGVNWLRFQHGSGPNTTPPKRGGKGRRRLETQARGVRLTAFPMIPQPYSRGHRNADHLDERRKDPGCHWNRRGRGKRLRHQATPPDAIRRTQATLGRGLGNIPVAPERRLETEPPHAHAREHVPDRGGHCHPCCRAERRDPNSGLPVDYRIRHAPVLRVPRKHGKRCTSVIVFAKGVLAAKVWKNTEEFQASGV